MNKEELISKLVEIYKIAQESGELAIRLGVVYNVLNKTFSISIDDKVYTLPLNNVADDPNIGDDIAYKIKKWAE